MSTLALDGTRPRSRRRDPVTSVDAGRFAALSASQWEVLRLFMEQGRPLADHELVAVAWGSPFTPQRIRSARAELAESGLLVLVEDFYRKTATGHRARLWALKREG